MHLPSLLALFTLHLSLIAATDLTLPTLSDRHNLTSHLEKRASCGDGTSCLIGVCCGDGCAMNCCAMDNGGLGCGITERCQFKGDVFVGCCGNLLGGCTGEATRVTVHTPYRTVTLNPSAGNSVTNDAVTTTQRTRGNSVSQTSTSTSTSTSTTATLTLPSLSSTREGSVTETAEATITTTTTTTATSTSSEETESETATAGNGNGNTAGGSSEGGFSQMPNGAGRVRGVFGMGMGMGVVLGVLGVI